MTRLLERFARIALRVPALTIVAILLVTGVFGAAAGRLVVDTGISSFAPPGGPAERLDAVEERFGSGSTIQIVVDDGPGGDVLERDALVAVLALAERIASHPDVAPILADTGSDAPPVVTFAEPFARAAEAADTTLAEADPFVLDVLVEAVLDTAGDRVSGLLSDDLDPGARTARAGLVIVRLDGDAEPDAVAAASRAVEDVVATSAVDDAALGVLSITAIEDAVADTLARDVPTLVSLSLLLVVLVLVVLFRSFLDVAVGLVGLGASIVWMVGAAALLGPGGLGITGPFNQVSVAVPVLLIGLGIDYSVHLTTRYREERRKGARAEDAATTALTTVGIALVLATIASVAGFLANLVTPLPPIRDFGVFAAIGIVAAFLVLAGLVVAVRVLVDRRRDRRALRGRGAPAVRSATDAPAGGTVGTVRPSVEATDGRGRGGWAGALTTVASRGGALVAVLTVLALSAGAFAATGLSTEFDERDFLPEGEPVLATLDRLEARFGGGVTERTLVAVDADALDPVLLAAVAGFSAELGEVEGVRRTDGEADVTSWLALRDRLVDEGASVRERVVDDLATWRDPAAAAADLRVPRRDELDLLADDLADGAELDDRVRAALVRRLPDGVAPLVALARAGDPDDLERELRRAIADALAEDRPAGLDDATLVRLAALDADAITLAELAAAGIDGELLSADDRRALERLEALAAVGPVDAADGATLVRQLEVLRRLVPDELARTVDGEGLLVSIATNVGADGAAELIAELEARAERLRDAGGEVTVVSSGFVQADIVGRLASAQLASIAISLAAAALLLVVSSWVQAGAPMLGLIGILPSLVALVLMLGIMRVIGLPFNALTATVASIAVGIGVPYGIHLINRFREALGHGASPEAAIAETLEETGPALVGSALTTGLAFAVLMLSSSTPLSQFGLVSTMMIVLAVLGCLMVQPAALVAWARRRERVGNSPVAVGVPDGAPEGA
jgi:predicted RND superfamily exporter protein